MIGFAIGCDRGVVLSLVVVLVLGLVVGIALDIVVASALLVGLRLSLVRVFVFVIANVIGVPLVFGRVGLVLGGVCSRPRP